MKALSVIYFLVISCYLHGQTAAISDEVAARLWLLAVCGPSEKEMVDKMKGFGFSEVEVGELKPTVASFAAELRSLGVEASRSASGEGAVLTASSRARFEEIARAAYLQIVSSKNSETRRKFASVLERVKTRTIIKSLPSM